MGIWKRILRRSIWCNFHTNYYLNMAHTIWFILNTVESGRSLGVKADDPGKDESRRSGVKVQCRRSSRKLKLGSSALAQEIACFRPSGSSAIVGIVRFRPDRASVSAQLWYDPSLMSRDRFHNPYAQSIINTTPSFSSWIFLAIIRWPPHFTNGSSRDMNCITWHIIWPLSHDSEMSRDLFPPNGNRINISCGRKMIKLNYSE